MHRPSKQEVWDRLKSGARRAGHLLRRSAVEAKELTAQSGQRLESHARRGGDMLRRGAGEARDLAARSGERLQTVWEPERPTEILRDSQLFRPLPETLPPSSAHLLSIPWRSDVLLALSAAGVLSVEDEVIGITRRLFHDDLPTRQLSERLFGQDFASLHRWIDTVPGSAVPGGGITHRVAHGHDLQAAAEVYEQYGLTGVLAWAQHMGQDAFTPTGVPLPVGAQSLASWLVEQGHASPGHAALMVSFNVVELAASFLAGAFALRLAILVREIQTRRRVKKRCTEALRARERGDIDGVIANYSEALSLSGGDPGISLALGWAYREIGRPAAESFLAFRRAATDLATRDRVIEVHGVTLSLRGLAYLLALVEARQVLEQEDLRGAWRSELDRMLRGAVSSFEVAAISQIDRPGVRVGERELAWRPRPLSAAANYYLAARTVASVPFVQSSDELERLREQALSTVSSAGAKLTDDDSVRPLTAVAERWKLELASDFSS